MEPEAKGVPIASFIPTHLILTLPLELQAHCVLLFTDTWDVPTPRVCSSCFFS